MVAAVSLTFSRALASADTSRPDADENRGAQAGLIGTAPPCMDGQEQGRGDFRKKVRPAPCFDSTYGLTAISPRWPACLRRCRQNPPPA